MFIYQVWDTSDPAGSDTWLETMSDAAEHVSSRYGLIATKIVRTGWSAESEEFGTISIKRHSLAATRRGVCEALNHLPMR